MPPLFITANELSPMRLKCAIKLRCVRTYLIPDRDATNSIKSRECLFHDKEGSFVHGHIPGNCLKKFDNTFKEGRVYMVKGFLAITTFYTYKTCDRELMIKFSESTEVREYKHINFPRTMFRLKPFSELKDPEKFDDKILIGKASRLIDFVLEDDNLTDLETPLRSINTKLKPITKSLLLIPSPVVQWFFHLKNIGTERFVNGIPAGSQYESSSSTICITPFWVMQILNDPALVDAHCPELLEDSENEEIDKQLLDAEDDEEEFVSDDEVQSPINSTRFYKGFSTQSGSGPVKEKSS
nr:replication protein A 70 kDa DNA-binding subunit B-like [Ipomoea batatas]